MGNFSETATVIKQMDQMHIDRVVQTYKPANFHIKIILYDPALVVWLRHKKDIDLQDMGGVAAKVARNVNCYIIL